MALPAHSVNHRFPSGPAAISVGPMPAFEGDSLITPPVVIRPILLPPASVNQRFPSGPAVIPLGKATAVGRLNSLYLLTSGTARAGIVVVPTTNPTKSPMANTERVAG